MRWTITENADSNVDTRVETRGDQQVIVVDARDSDGNYLNQLDLVGSVIYPDRDTDEPIFRQVAPGRYEASFSPNQEGAYIISVTGATDTESPVTASIAQSTGWVLSYSREYSVNEPDSRFLQEIAAITGGASIAGNPAAAFLHNLDQEEAALPIVPLSDCAGGACC